MKQKTRKWALPLSALFMALAGAGLYSLLPGGPAPELVSKGGAAVQEPGIGAGKVILALFFVLSLIVVLGWITRQILVPRLLQQQKTGALAVVDSLALSPKSKVLLIRVSEKLLLLGVTEQSITFINEIDDPTLLQASRRNSSGADNPSFLQFLQKSR